MIQDVYSRRSGARQCGRGAGDGRAALDFLNSPAADPLDGPGCGDVLISLGEIRSKATAAHVTFLRRFDAADAHDADGYGTSSAWLAAKAKMSRAGARAAVGQMRLFRA
ncbi:MAG TPA: hypothetical protein VNV62_09455, partial [Trebonia sp.]|nr:hypothetical protein [Trebonia sp.]